MRNLLSSGSGLAQQQASVLGSGTDVNQLGSATAALLPYLIPNLAAYYDFTDSSKLTADASNRVSFARDVSGNSGTLGLVLPGTAANSATAPSSAPVQITGDIDLRCYCASSNWSAAGAQVMVGKDDAATNRSYLLFAPGGSAGLNFGYSNNGSTFRSATSTTTHSFANYAAGWFRATYATGTGVVTFYTSTDGTTWVQLGNTVTLTSGTIYNGTAVVRIGDNGTSFPNNQFSGIIYRAQIYNGIAGTLAFDANFSAQTYGLSNAATFVESSSNAATVTINGSGALGARIAGARDLAMLTGSAQPQLLPWSGNSYLWCPGVASNYASFSALTAFSTGDFTVSCGIKANSLAALGLIFSGATNSFGLKLNTDGTLQSTKRSVADNTASSGTLVANTTYTVTYVRSGTTGTYYINAAASGTTTDNRDYSVGVAAVGAGTDGSSPLSANVSWVRVYSAALSAGQVTADAAGTVQTNCVFDCDFTQQVNNAASFTSGTRGGATGITVTVNSTGSKPAQVVGKQSLLTDAAAYYMQSPAYSGAQPVYRLAVIKQNTWGAGNILIDGQANTAKLYQTGSTPSLTVNAGADGPANTAATLLTWRVVDYIMSGASSVLGVDGGTDATGNASTGAPNGITIGASKAGANFAGMQIAYLFEFLSAPDAATRSRIRKWAARQMGLSGIN